MQNPTKQRVAHSGRWLAAFALASSGCGSAVGPDGSVQSDAAADTVATADAPMNPPRDASVDGGSTQCTTGSQRRMEINGVVSETAAVTATELFLDCCDSAAIDFVSARFTDSLSVVWRVQGGTMPSLPTTVDLAHLPSTWSVEVWVGCSPSTSSCMPSARFDTGLTGTLTVARTDATGRYRMNVCLAFNENPASPHPTIHSFALASGEVVAP